MGGRQVATAWLPVCCPRCGRRITKVRVRPPIGGLELAGSGFAAGSRFQKGWVVATKEAAGFGRRLTFACPGKRCPIRVTRLRDELARDYVEAMKAGRSKLILGADELTPSR